MNKKTKIILLASIVLIIATIVFYPQIKNYYKADSSDTGSTTAKSSNQRPPLNVNAIVLSHQNLTDVFRTKGRLLPDEEVDLTFETSGKITSINFREGNQVRKGELLAKVNDKPLQAELKKLEAQLPLAQERVARQRTLLAKDAVSQEAFESVTTELEKLNADLELVKAKIAQTELRAPFDGVIGLRFVSEGAFASPTTIISTLTKISPLKVEFSVNEKQANSIKNGTPLQFSVEGDLKNYDARVYAVESKLDERTLSLKARALYPNTDGRLKPGHSATVEIKLSEITNTLVIPAMSSIAEMGRDIAYIYKNGKAEQVVIKKGMRTSSSLQILDGLNVGDTLLVSGVMQLRAGMEVKINIIEQE